ncbi:hypothetical protein LCL61_29560 [Amycolatopsis coloradensis]|uniref:Uncharacterized protein n=1 Tax=Amycolatopsis coloradensis TaxID=76021 RepID=A0ACD5BPP2_9PSEU
MRGSYNELAKDEKHLQVKIAALDEVDSATPQGMTADEVPLIDALPYLATNLAKAPEPYLRALFEAVQLAIVVHDDGEHATITIKLPEIAQVAEKDHRTHEPSDLPAQRTGSACEVPVGAPGQAPPAGRACR